MFFNNDERTNTIQMRTELIIFLFKFQLQKEIAAKRNKIQDTSERNKSLNQSDACQLVASRTKPGKTRHFDVLVIQTDPLVVRSLSWCVSTIYTYQCSSGIEWELLRLRSDYWRSNGIVNVKMSGAVRPIPLSKT